MSDGSNAAFGVTVDKSAPRNGRLWYRVVTGESIRSHVRELYDYYTSSSLISWLRTITGHPTLSTSPHVRSAININCIDQPGQRYPWHRDASPYTAVLFLSTVEAAAGGAFVIQGTDGARTVIQPTRGLFLFMDGTLCSHAVAPLRAFQPRLTVPMVYPIQPITRPEGLDHFLYASGADPQ